MADYDTRLKALMSLRNIIDVNNLKDTEAHDGENSSEFEERMVDKLCN